MRLGYYAGASTAAAAACLLKAFHERPNFYSATVYLSQSNACLLILTNLLLVLACAFMFALQRLLYGPLRPIEIEQLSEKAWYAVLDTLLAMPSFREDVGGWLLAMFCLLLAGKVWGWIGEGRVDILEQQPPANPRLFHARLATSLVFSVVFDLWMLDYCVETVLADPRPGMMVIFTFEFAILSVFSSFTLARYGLSLIQTRIEKLQIQKAIDERKQEIRAERASARQNETADGQPAPASSPDPEPIEVDENEIDVPGWEDKRRYLFALELLTDFVKLMIYIVFFTVSITFNGLPMHIMRDVYMTFASFSKRVADYVAYRKATSDMNGRYPDATTEEIRGEDCIVCREGMVAWEQAPVGDANARPAGEQPPAAPAPARRRDEGLRAKKLPCGHILHLRCLKAWLERQQVCPTCRRPVVVAPTPTATGQQGGGGAGGNQQGRPPAQQQQRQGRARILNFGPIRIGFLNGPGDQIGNIIRQMQNPNQNQAQGQQGGAAGGGGQEAQQGPNHLGLQVPYADGGPGGAPGSGGGARSTLPTHIQIMQIEQRLVQEAHNLGLEQQQLGTLRMMEGELARLRAMQQQTTGAQRQQTHFAPPPPPPGFPPPMMMQQPFGGFQAFQQQAPIAQHPPQAFQGSGNQQFGTGHESLPEGMTLPEGWTVMPLRRADGGVAGVNEQPTVPAAADASAVVDGQQTSSTAMNGGQSATTQAGPRDDNGSLYFVPTVTPAAPATSTHGAADTTPAAPATATNSDVNTIPAATQEQNSTAEQSSQPQSQDEYRTPWNSEGWSFVEPEPANAHTAGEGTNDQQQQPAPSEPANGAPPEQSYEGKGKAKAAEVEDVPDSEA
ncbi:E3 ubiquitin-protein ligase hrd1 [Vermiconidia calcicola]|uniref:E3 ubiquitin-protein ligase hrd1 n=1 Tax=Vermiconidia calcicola TaxID=1690605 RepID=A0ACC3NP37_9PEZI|nr:E3 ubiquitin-protein ligase hrd1 [Vermiconidia calcicola]